jgi:hypothetical protein
MATAGRDSRPRMTKDGSRLIRARLSLVEAPPTIRSTTKSTSKSPDTVVNVIAVMWSFIAMLFWDNHWLVAFVIWYWLFWVGLMRDLRIIQEHGRLMGR